MRKIIFMTLLATSTMLLAKEENPNIRKELKNSPKETFLVAKKNFKSEKVIIKIAKATKPAAMNLEGCLAIAFNITAVDPPLGTAMVSSCLETYSK